MLKSEREAGDGVKDTRRWSGEVEAGVVVRVEVGKGWNRAETAGAVESKRPGSSNQGKRK